MNGGVVTHTNSIRVTDEWNALPEEIVSIKSLLQFKTSLDKHWISQRFDTYLLLTVLTVVDVKSSKAINDFENVFINHLIYVLYCAVLCCIVLYLFHGSP